MFQKKINVVLTLFVAISIIYSCVDDDVCDEVATPRLTVLIQDSLGNKLKKDSLYIDRKNSDGTISNVGVFVGMDSLKIALNAISNETVFYIYDSLKTPDADKNILTLHYQTEQKFVSKACGFMVLYTGMTYNSQLKNIKKITPNTTELQDETSTQTHIHISEPTRLRRIA